MKRVRRMQTNNDVSWKEQHIPVQSSHVDAMVNRIRDCGFINFYGEQRVGDAGHQNHVGVRSFDVGRAMLREDFATAIDLIMDGRSDEVYNPSSEEVEAREVWRKTKDARLTLAKFPKNTSTMTRERDLIRGLVRYDDALEAIRCVHHNVRMFWIHAYQVRSIRYTSSFAEVSLTQNDCTMLSHLCGTELPLKESKYMASHLSLEIYMNQIIILVKMKWK